MNPTLNSPKYADPKSLAFQMYKKQQDRKQRINPYVPQLEQRYFRRNEGSTDYATIPEVTLAGDFVIEFDLLPINETFHILSGSASVQRLFQSVASNKIEIATSSGFTQFTGVFTSAKMNTAILSRVSGTMSLVVNGIALAVNAGATNNGVFEFDQIYNVFGNPTSVPNLSGILANLKIWDNGELIHYWKINSNANTEADLVSGATMTFINGNADDWGLFDRQANGDWLGQELVVNGGFDTPNLSQWTTGNATLSVASGELEIVTSAFANNAKVEINMPASTYRFKTTAVSTSTTSFKYSVFNLTAVEEYIPATIYPIGGLSIDVAVTTQGNVGFYVLRDSGGVGTYISDNVSVKEVLKNA